MTALRPEPQTMLIVSAGRVAGKSCLNQCLSGGRLARPALDDLPHDDVFNGPRVDPGARDGFTDDHGAKLGGTESGETAEILADGGANGGQDDGGGTVAHSSSSGNWLRAT